MKDKSVVWKLRKALDGVRRASLLLKTFLWDPHRESGVQECRVYSDSRVTHRVQFEDARTHVDDPLCFGQAKLVDTLFTALGQWLTKRIAETIGLKPVVFLGSHVWSTHTMLRDAESKILGRLGGSRVGSRSRKTHHVTRSRHQGHQ